MNENRIVESDKIIAADHRSIATIGMFCVGVTLFLLIVLSAMIGPKSACIALFILIGIAVLLWLAIRSHERWMIHRHHVQEIDNQQHHIDMTKQAINRGYSVHFEHPDGRKVILTSPLTIPGAPVTIKELNWGDSPQIAAPLTLPDKTMAIDIMRKWALTPQNLFLALGKGGKEYACTLEGLMHVAHDAPTGQGKTAQWKAEIIQLLKLNIQVILCNPHFAPVDKKGNDWRPIGQAIEAQGWIEVDNGIRIPGLIRKYETIVKMLKWLALKEIDRRFNLQAQGDYSYTPLYIFVDEWPSVVNRFPQAGDYLVDVLQRGRAVDVCVDTNAQGFLQNDVDLKGSARENFQTAYHMGGSVHSGAKLLDMPVKDMNSLLRNENITLGQGIALLRNNESVPQAELVRLPYADNTYVYYMLGKAENWILPEFRTRNIHEEVYQSSSNGIHEVNEMNTMNEPMKPYEYNMNIHEQHEQFMNIQNVSEKEKAAILGAAQTQMNMTGKVIRTKVRDDLGWNNAQFPKIKQVLDEEGL